jgi:hypothetical protein
MARADSAKFSAIFKQVETLHQLGTDQTTAPAPRRSFRICIFSGFDEA